MFIEQIHEPLKDYRKPAKEETKNPANKNWSRSSNLRFCRCLSGKANLVKEAFGSTIHM